MILIRYATQEVSGKSLIVIRARFRNLLAEFRRYYPAPLLRLVLFAPFAPFRSSHFPRELDRYPKNFPSLINSQISNMFRSDAFIVKM